ncbi:MAG: hypothetical protein HY329_28170 [Chloroflexi bacterium]|nr:hypothetical protein [Chloroflexota bacterium]
MAYFIDPTREDAQKVCAFFAKVDHDDIDIICDLLEDAMYDGCVDASSLRLALRGTYKRMLRGYHDHLLNWRDRVMDLTVDEFIQVCAEDFSDK